MKILKVENVSNMKLDFFLKQNQEDIRVVLEPGDTSWCDLNSSTKSMILYERKNLIKTSEDVGSSPGVEVINLPEDSTTDITPIQTDSIEPTKDNTVEINPKEEDKKEYKGKKRGRKKKRGPKPGSKKNKGNNPTEG